MVLLFTYTSMLCCRDYTPILSLEQRRRYKDDFNSNYNEYRRLHTIVAKVSSKFVQLEQRLLQEEKNSEGYKVRIKSHTTLILLLFKKKTETITI